MNRPFIFRSGAFFLLRLYMDSELPKLCRISCLSLAAPLRHCKAPWTLPVALLIYRKEPGATLSVQCTLAVFSGLGSPCKPFAQPHQLSVVRSPVYCFLHPLLTMNRLGHSGLIVLREQCGFDARMGETGWIARSWVIRDNAAHLLPRDAISAVPTVCFHCTVDARAPASVRTELG